MILPISSNGSCQMTVQDNSKNSRNRFGHTRHYFFRFGRNYTSMRTLTERWPGPRKRKSSPVPERSRPEEKTDERQPAVDGELADMHPSGEGRRPVTNTEEQNQITNAVPDAFDDTEREGG